VAVTLLAGSPEGAEAAADGLLGLYGLALNISRIPWQATIAITFVVFPLVSESTFAADAERTRTYIRQTLRYTMLLVGLAAVVLAAVPGAIVGLLPAKYAPAALALAWLAPAYFAFSLFNVVNTLLMSAGRAGLALGVGLAGVGSAALLYWLWLPGAADADALLVRAGQATLVAFVLGLAVGLVALHRLYGPPVPLASAARVLGLGGALVAAGRLLVPELGRVASLAVAVAVGLAFLVGLVLLREFNAEDKARLGRVLRRKKTSP
jgi:O-antigen/teichoic acid export membrane protein